MTDPTELDRLLDLPEDDPRVVAAGAFWPATPVVDALEDLGPALPEITLGLLSLTATSPQSSVLRQARADIGMGESPANSNHNAITEWYNANVAKIGNGPWCAMSTTHWYWAGGAKSIVVGRAYVPWAIGDWLKGYQGGTFHWGVAGMRAGDHVFYDWSRSGVRSAWKGDHTGIVETGWDGSTFTSIEGNYGDRCGRFKRDAKYVLGYGRPNWAKVSAGTGGSSAPTPTAPKPDYVRAPYPGHQHGDSTKDDHHVEQIQKRLSQLGFYKGAIDERFGPKTEAAVRAFQKSKRISVDGWVGRQTWVALGIYERP